MVAMSLASVAVIGVIEAQTMNNAPHETSSHRDLRKLSGQKIVIRVGDKAFTVELYDNDTAKDLVSRLPLTLNANNYPGYDEKIIRLPSALSMKGAPRGDEPEIPEVGYYAPGQWVALYYGPIGYWPGKVPLGRIHARVEQIHTIPDHTPVTLERATD
ncbi:hypothetical protein ISS98_21725 [Dyella flagellata]